MALTPLQVAAADRTLSNAAFRLYVYLHRELDATEYRPLKVESVGRDVGLHYTNILRHMKLLSDLGYMDRDVTRQPYRYRLPQIAQVGNCSHLK